MTAVRPLARFNIIRKSTRAGLIKRRCRKDAPTDVIADVNEQSNEEAGEAGFRGESFAANGELLSSLSPLLFSMKLFGLYFRQERRPRPRPTDDPELNEATTKTGSAWSKLRVYATAVLILSWLNAFRLASMFTKSDRFGAVLLFKIAVFTSYCLSAIMNTAYYFASYTGQLAEVLLTLPVTPECVRGAHRVAVCLTSCAWITAIVQGTFSVYFYFFNDGNYDFSLSPFVTYIVVPEDKTTIARLIGIPLNLSPFPCSLFVQVMTQVFVYVFYHQFGKLNQHFCRALGKQGEFKGDLSVFRRRHSLVDEEDLGLRRLQQLTLIRVAPSTSPDIE